MRFTASVVVRGKAKKHYGHSADRYVHTVQFRLRMFGHRFDGDDGQVALLIG
ncbi:hypothetical protein OP10G_2537 [Fimbriimonas ginsengisoli Gsoil 348]|uniref:Uncharacterized protein n=1 Tax=Fimbriimonas ginsengisoli Gsoil 348 TaxID=661478 RepID=A0A068NT04_FIMGI|nr:hypothetical protein OP10G_2537 [Fimbriimonas ginsengisoli Gsoil 348]